eukprot:scaffold7381_cov310-Pinguiococcus_pyrenoidosus.AAC.52
MVWGSSRLGRYRTNPSRSSGARHWTQAAGSVSRLALLFYWPLRATSRVARDHRAFSTVVESSSAVPVVSFPFPRRPSSSSAAGVRCARDIVGAPPRRPRKGGLAESTHQCCSASQPCPLGPDASFRIPGSCSSAESCPRAPRCPDWSYTPPIARGNPVDSRRPFASAAGRAHQGFAPQRRFSQRQ